MAESRSAGNEAKSFMRELETNLFSCLIATLNFAVPYPQRVEARQLPCRDCSQKLDDDFILTTSLA